MGSDGRTWKTVAPFHPNSQPCVSRLLVSESVVIIGATAQPATFVQPVRLL